MGQNNDPKEHGDLQGQQGGQIGKDGGKKLGQQSGEHPGGNTQNGQGSDPKQKSKNR